MSRISKTVKFLGLGSASALVFFGGLYTVPLLSGGCKGHKHGAKPPQQGADYSLGKYGGSTPTSRGVKIWDELARDYDSQVAAHERVIGVQKMRKNLIKQAKGNVLEVGCGKLFCSSVMWRCCATG